MNLAFAGTPEFARRALAALLAAGHRVSLVLTQPDRPAGRGLQLRPSPVKEFALANDLPLYQPERLKDATTQQPLRDAAPEVLVVAAYGLILPQAVLDIPRCGCLNIHASLLPRWRGAAPIQRAIEAGDTETGISIMQMDAGLDTGALALSEHVPIAADETAMSLHDKLAALGARLIVAALEQLAHCQLELTPQPQEGVTYAGKIGKEEARIDWRQPAAVIERRLRAFTPTPALTTQWRGAALKILAAQAISGQGVAGTLLAADNHGIVIACGADALRITALQKAGGRRLTTAEFLAGETLRIGDKLSATPPAHT